MLAEFGFHKHDQCHQHTEGEKAACRGGHKGERLKVGNTGHSHAEPGADTQDLTNGTHEH
ncbi:hypothetical protein EVA_15738 [gut metagenome]|uniref:Uncharacterized protein n=1 Tax=gut metagenome TaxID=749906 RepID=J9C8F9_9ZZZZ